MIVADIEDLAAAEFLHMLSLNRKSGKLTGAHGEDKVVVAFHAGSIVYAASTAVREKVGSMLVGRKLISEEQLHAAIAEQQRHSGLKHMGNILVEMGVISREALTEVVRSQFQRVLGSLSALEDSRRDLRARRVARQGAAAHPFAPPPSPATVRAAAAGREERPGAPPGSDADSVVRSMMEEMQSLSLSFDAEMTLAVLSSAAEVVDRCVFFLVLPESLSCAGGFGTACDGDSAEVVVRKLAVPCRPDSVFHRVIEEGRTYRGPLASTASNRRLIEQLGGTNPHEVVMVPMLVCGRVVAILYGDNGAEGRPIPPLAPLEAVVQQTGAAIESRRR